MLQDIDMIKKIRYTDTLNKVYGFSILESMFALALFAAFTLAVILFNNTDARKKDAKILSNQTNAFAIAYATYMNLHRVEIESQANKNQIVTLAPPSLGNFWPVDLSTRNMYHQTPCVTVVKNNTTNDLEAMMYYVGRAGDLSYKALDIIRNASIDLGDIGGIYINGSAIGSSGWKVDATSSFFSGASQCGGQITNNSLVVNLDLLPQWNHSLQSTDSLLRGLDNESGLLSMPGHVKNSNTLKSNLYFASGKGVILDNSDPQNPTRLAVLYNGQGSRTSTIGFGTTATTTLVSDTLQPSTTFQAGDSCLAEEIGKTVIDRGASDEINQVLARSTLVCTQNDMLCGTDNYCYLPTQANQIIFQNKNQGIQNSNGQFICPKYVPFAVDIKTGILGGGQIYVIQNNGGATSPDSMLVTLNKNGVYSTQLNCPPSGCPSGIRVDGKSAAMDGMGELLSVDLATILGSMVGLTANSQSNISYTAINGSMGDYTTTVGYQVTLAANNCSEVCANLKNTLGFNWEVLGAYRASRIGSGVTIKNQQLGCACERTDFIGANHDNYMGISAVIESAQGAIISATCSNMPMYYQN